MKFKFLAGDVNWKQYGGKFISKRLNNGDFNYYLVMDVLNMHDATGDEDQPKYNVSIQAVSPESVNPDKLQSILSDTGMRDLYDNPEFQAEVLSEYGIFALLWQKDGDNLNSLMWEARREADLIESLFGFYMDKPENRIGQNGWQLIRGQDVREFLGIE